ALNLDANDSSGAGGNDYAAIFLAGGSAVNIADTDTALTDVDDTNMESAVITLSGGVVDGANESISISGTPGTMGGVTIAYTSATQIDLTGTATLAEYQAVIEAIEYNNSAAGAATGGDRTVSVKVNDGENDSNTATSTITVNAMPKFTSATYNASNGQLVITGTDFVSHSGDDLIAAMLTITGEGGTYTLTDTPNVEISSGTEATVTLSSTDKLHVDGLLNRDGLSSASSTYNLAGADGWMPQSPGDESDTVGNAINVTAVAAPTITDANYDSDTGVVTVTGTNFSHKVGASNDIDVSTFTFTGGAGNATYDITSAVDVEIISSTSFTFTLTGADKTNVDALLDQIGTSSSGGSTYNIAGADGWITGADSAADIADTAGNAVTVTINPKIDTSTYDAATGVLVVTGTNIQANGGGDDIDASRFTFTGEGGATYQLTDSPDVERTSVTEFSLILSATDKAAVNQMLNKDGLSSTGGTAYKLEAGDDWNTNVTAGDTSDTDAGNTITVSNVPAPAITDADYDAATGVLTVTGTNFLKRDGATNDIDVTKLSLEGEGGTSYTLTGSHVEITSSTEFSITLNASDSAAVNQILNKNGTTATGGATYNLKGVDDWAVGADASVDVADETGNAVDVSNVAVPTITDATYDATSGVLNVTGTDFLKLTGGTNDINVGNLAIEGEGGASHTLTSANVEITS
ncbi:MAG: DUF4214 domain-containing protein, partial [Gammaproteobacteria bacterium]|nr:DUF4214 domain-containing protein [Gammaproteobacteria bacterium]